MSFGKSQPSAPAAPDYTGAAQATAAGNMQSAQQAQQANMVNQYTPYGSLTYSQDQTSRFGGNPSYSANINLSPTGQKLLDNQNTAALGLGDATNSALGRVQDTMSKPMDQTSVQGVADQAYKNYTSRLDPQWQHSQAMTENQLVNQGLRPGTEAYDNAMRDFNNAKNDAYTQANTASINTMPQTYQLDTSMRNQPLNELNALRTGSQVTNPQFSSSPQQQTVGGADYLGATNSMYGTQMNGYNAGTAANSGMMGGLMGLAGKLGSAYLMS